MKNWTEFFESHPIHITLRNVRRDLKSITITDIKDPLDIENAIHRLKLITNYLFRILKKLDPIMVYLGNLDKMNQILVGIQSDLEQFKDSKNVDILENANNRGSNLVFQMSNLIFPKDVEDIESIRGSITSFRRTVGHHLSNTQKEVDTFNDNLDKLKTEVDDTISKIEGQKSRIDNAILGYQTQFSSAQDTRSTDFLNALGKIKEDVESEILRLKDQSKPLLDQSEKNLQAIEKNVEGKASAIIASMNKSLKDAQDIVGIISVTGMAAAYKEVADKERKTAFWWKIGAVGSIIGLIAFGILLFIGGSNEKIVWTSFAAKIFVATAFGILAAYTAKQADKADDAERRTRKMALEFTSITPYLADLDKEKQQEIKVKLSEKMFGKEEERKFHGKGDIPKNLLALFKLFLEEYVKPLINKSQ